MGWPWNSVPNIAPEEEEQGDGENDTCGLARSSSKQVPLTTKVLQDTTAAIPSVSTIYQQQTRTSLVLLELVAFQV